MTQRWLPGVLIAMVTLPLGAAAQDRPGLPSREVRGQLGASVNNAGVQNTIDLSWNWPLTRSEHPLMKEARVSAGVTHALTPAQTRLGGWVELTPLSLFSVKAGVEPSAYFGTFNSLQSFAGYDERFDKDARDARGGATAGTGLRMYASPTVRMKAGPIVGAATADFEWWKSSAAGPLFYEPTRDTLLDAGGDRLIALTSVLMYQRDVTSGTMSAGMIHTRMSVRNAPANDVQKIGAIAVRQYAGRRFFLPNPRLTLVVAKYLDDPSKDGQWTAAVAVGFRK